MRRRRDVASNPLPANLRRFVADEWPGESEWHQYGAFCDALERWGEDHPNVSPWEWIEVGREAVPWNPELDPP